MYTLYILQYMYAYYVYYVQVPRKSVFEFFLKLCTSRTYIVLCMYAARVYMHIHYTRGATVFGHVFN